MLAVLSFRNGNLIRNFASVSSAMVFADENVLADVIIQFDYEVWVRIDGRWDR